MAVFPPFPGGSWTTDLFRWITSVDEQGLIINNPAVWQKMIMFLEYHLTDQVKNERWRVARCEACSRPLAVVVDPSYKTIRTYPLSTTEAEKEIHESVRRDYEEARLCFSAGAYKGAVLLCRRALQGAAIDKGADAGVDPRETLNRQLDALAKEGSLNSSLADVAKEIRLLGNYGAHPQDDGLDEVSKDQADDVVQLTGQVLEDLYVNPARVARLRERHSPRTVESPSEAT